MRPASEIISALRLLQHELGIDAEPEVDDRDELLNAIMHSEPSQSPAEQRRYDNLLIAHDVLAWVAGEDMAGDDETAWLCAYLLDDPPRRDNTPPEVN